MATKDSGGWGDERVTVAFFSEREGCKKGRAVVKLAACTKLADEYLLTATTTLSILNVL